MKIVKHQFKGNGQIKFGYTVSNEKVSFFVHPENYDEHYADKVIDEGLHLLNEATDMYINYNFTNDVDNLEDALLQQEKWEIEEQKRINDIEFEDLSNI